MELNHTPNPNPTQAQEQKKVLLYQKKWASCYVFMCERRGM